MKNRLKTEVRDIFCNLASTCTHMNNGLFKSGLKRLQFVTFDCICFGNGKAKTILQPKLSGVQVTPSVTSVESS